MTTPVKARHNSLRLKGFDYSQPGAYFVTLCTYNRRRVLGEVVDGRMVLSEVGRVVEDAWRQIPDHFKNTSVDVFQIMPDHVHGIVEIRKCPDSLESSGGLINQIPTAGITVNQTPASLPESTDWILMKQPGLQLGKIIRAFKAKCARIIRQSYDPRFRWQRSFYDHIIRGDIEHYFIEQYIELNPLMWDIDSNNPASGLRPLDELRLRLQKEHGLTGTVLERIMERERSYRGWAGAELEGG